MTWLPFGRKGGDAPPAASAPAETTVSPYSAMDLLVERACGRDEFFLLYLRLLQERMPTATLTMLSDSVIGMVDENGKEATVYMDNVWSVYMRGHVDRRELLDRYVRHSMILTQEMPAPALEDIVAMIKDTEFQRVFKADNLPMSAHLCGDLWIVYAIDRPESMATLSRSKMLAAGLNEEDLLALSLGNLQRILPAAERHGQGPWFLLAAGGDYTASLLLFDDLWDSLAEDVDGDIVAVVPARDTLLYTGSNSAAGLAAIRDRAQRIVARGDNVISETLIQRRGGKWQAFQSN